jgi:hypothetical protein
MRGIEVMVSPIGPSGGRFSVPKGTWVICGENIHRQRYVDPSEALKVALAMRGPKRSVIIRPNYNETHLRKESTHPSGYREWRSFDGGLFTEIHFFCDSDHQAVMVRLDAEIVLPPIPPV